MSLMTIEQVRGHITETDLEDEALGDLVDAADSDITEWAGALTFTDDAVDPVSETLTEYGMTYLRLKQRTASVELVVDTTGSTELDLTEDVDYLVEGDLLRRLGGYKWGDRTTVDYTPVDSTAQRRRALIALVKLAINDEPGVGSETAGPWNRSSLGKRQDTERDRILRNLRDPDLIG